MLWAQCTYIYSWAHGPLGLGLGALSLEFHLEDHGREAFGVVIQPTWRIMGLSKYGSKYLKWGYK